MGVLPPAAAGNHIQLWHPVRSARERRGAACVRAHGRAQHGRCKKCERGRVAIQALQNATRRARETRAGDEAHTTRVLQNAMPASGAWLATVRTSTLAGAGLGLLSLRVVFFWPGAFPLPCQPCRLWVSAALESRELPATSGVAYAFWSSCLCYFFCVCCLFVFFLVVSAVCAVLCCMWPGMLLLGVVLLK
jgi:hypothetical protein